MAVIDEILVANEAYARTFTWGDLPTPPARRLAVVTCMDARIDPVRCLGLEVGDAHVIRNAGGLVTDDAIRSLIVSHNELGTEHVVVIGHTRCGLLNVSNEELQRRLHTDVDFLPFSDLDTSVRESVRRVRASPLLPASVRGFVYDVETGRLREVS